MYPYNRNTQLYHSRAKETQAEKPSLLAQDKRLEELLSLARTEATETARKFETLLDRAELSEAGQILRTMYLDGKKHLRLLQETIEIQHLKPAGNFLEFLLIDIHETQRYEEYVTQLQVRVVPA